MMEGRIYGFVEVMDRVGDMNTRLMGGEDRDSVFKDLDELKNETKGQGFTLKVVPLGPKYITVCYNSRDDKTSRFLVK